MTWPSTAVNTIHSLQAVERQLTTRFVGRAEAVRLLVLACVSRENLLLLGPPGTAKSDLVTCFSDLVSARRFSYLLTRFTEPSEIFGPVDFEKFRQGSYRISIDGMLPSADIVFLDEVFQGSSAILNTLLTVVNERVFHNGGVRQKVPMVSLFGASSDLPDDHGLRAFSDRFLLRLRVEPVAQARLPELLDRGWEHERERIADDDPKLADLVTVEALSDLAKQVRHIDLTKVRPEYAQLVKDLLAHGITLSDRRIVRSLKLVAAATLMRQADTAQPRDFWPLRHIWMSPGDAATTHEVVSEYLAADGGEQVTPPPLASTVVAQARATAARLGGRTDLPTHAVLNALRGLQRCRSTLVQHHPHDREAQSIVEQLIDQTTTHFDRMD